MLLNNMIIPETEQKATTSNSSVSSAAIYIMMENKHFLMDFNDCILDNTVDFFIIDYVPCRKTKEAVK